MKHKYAIALSMVAGFALGATAVQSLHAQAKPPAYTISEITVTDNNGYMKEFVPPAAKTVQAAGGKYVVRGGKAVSWQGAPPASRVVVLQWENVDKAQAWFDSPGRKEAQAIGNKYATFRTFVIEGVTP